MNKKTSFGKYFDDQRDKIVKDMQTGKNTELYNAWRKDYDKRHDALALLRKMAPVGPKEKKLLKEMIDAVNKGIDAKEMYGK